MKLKILNAFALLKKAAPFAECCSTSATTGGGPSGVTCSVEVSTSSTIASVWSSTEGGLSVF